MASASSLAIFDSALDSWATKAVVLIATIGQLFCGMACLTSASRMTFAFSRDRGCRVTASGPRQPPAGVPHFAVIFVAIAALLITLPALEGDENNFTYAFFAVVSIAVIGLYIAYVIPIFLRWRMGDSVRAGPVDARQEVQVGERRLGLLGRAHHDHLQPAVHARRRAVARRVRLEVRELRADHRARRDHRPSGSGGSSAPSTSSGHTARRPTGSTKTSIRSSRPGTAARRSVTSPV